MRAELTFIFDSVMDMNAFVLGLPAQPPTTPAAKASLTKVPSPKALTLKAKALKAENSPVKKETPTLRFATAEKAVEALFEAFGLETARDLLGRFNVQKARDLPPEHGHDFCLAAQQLLDASEKAA